MGHQTREKADSIRKYGQLSHRTGPLQGAAVPRRVGSFADSMYASFWPTFEEGAPDAVYWGSPYQSSWINVIVEKGGRLYWCERMHGLAVNKRLPFIASPEGDFLSTNPNVPIVESNLEFTWDPKKGLHYIDRDPKHGCEITITDKTAHWIENGAWELKGKIAAPATAMILPTRRDGKAGVQMWYYEQFLAEGIVEGEPVRGFIEYEHHYGTVTWKDDTFYQGRGGLLTYGNEFEDGSVELGIVHCDEVMRGGIIVNEKGDELINTKSVNFSSTVTDGCVITDAVFTLDNSIEYKFKMHKGAATDFTNVGAPAAYPKAASWGRVSRVGDNRKIVRGWATAQAGRM